MKRLLVLFLSLLAITSCVKNSQNAPSQKEGDFGVFLGANSDSVNNIKNYEKVIIELDEFSESDIKTLKDNDCEIYGYLSIGSLEKYRSYYEQFKDLTFMDYDNWSDERWIDVSNITWQNHINAEAERLKNLGADGLFMDNFDVYYIAMEEYECSTSFKEGIYDGCHTILDNLSKKDLKLIINSGTDFLERMHDENDTLIKKIDIYAQECVFSSIIDYEKDIFSKQDEETKTYYQEIISFMKKNSTILLIEYTMDDSLISQIKNYCKENNFSYYISKSVNLVI